MKKILFVLILCLNLVIYGNTANEKFEVEQIEYYESGKLEHKGSFDEGKDDVKSIIPFGEGKVVVEDKKDGLIRYESGKLEHKGSFNEGKDHAKSITPYGEGKVIHKEKKDGDVYRENGKLKH